ncbi:VWA domain-containing protein [Virgibacillus siamensis]|uniref:VWA domain-containing protein n=1 Tax=Virgibacillus siamensis TaxID=480071 RepID=UPI00111577E7|nr:VWA domain-containing protein [Virgibacillus siamensis]
MHKKWLVFMIVILLFTLLAACGDSGNNNAKSEIDKQEEKEGNQNKKVNSITSNDKNEKEDKPAESEPTEKVKLKDLLPIPTDVEGLAKQTAGPFGGDKKNIYDLEQKIKKKFEKLGPMSKNPTDKEYRKYLRFMYWLVSENYPNPQDMIKKWEFASFGNPDLPDAKFHFKENYNVEIILDSSGSMANPAGNGTRMDVAKESINAFLSQLPEEANVSLRVYGHKGTGSEGDKEMSCNAIEQVYGFDSFKEGKFQKALDKFQPSGWTPLAGALKQSKKALSKFDTKKNTNLIYVVSDGIETCGGNPVKVAKSLANSNAKPIINIIGFQTDAEAQRQLEKMAEVSGGIFATADNEKELQEEFKRAKEVLEAWEEWKEDALKDVDYIEVENSFDIMGLHNDWYFTTLGTSNNLNSLANVMKDIGIITHDQKMELKDRVDDIIDEIDETVDELEVTLKEISEQKITEMKKSINERFENETKKNHK